MNIYDYPTIVQSAMQLLEEGLQSSTWLIRFACAEALSDLKKNQGLEELIAGLKQKDPCIRDRAIEAMGKLKDKALLPYFQKSLKDQDMLVRIHALESLSMTMEEQSLETIQECLKDKHLLMQECAVRCLENFIPKIHSHPILKQILIEHSYYYYSIPVFAAYSLAKEEEEVGKRFLYEMLENEDTWVAFNAAKKLALLKDRKGIDCIKQMLQYGGWKEKISALESLIALGEKDDLVPSLYRPSEVPGQAIRLEIARLLDAFYPENTAQLLEEAFSSQEEEICIRVIEIIGETRRADLLYLAENVIKKGPEYLRATLIKTIEKMNTINLLPYLLPILTKSHWLVRIQAARVILKLAL